MPSSTPGASFNVIALISGGKDSLYSILHCIRNGHKVVALANLYPEPKDGDDEEEEDIDSFMYQTIGHSVIPLYESALGIPLYRAPITGGAVDSARIYRHDAADQMAEVEDADADEDETEALIPLLRRIKREHPEANAVSAGAILSTYQRTRIENVAGRLGLVPMAWLWNYPLLAPPLEREGREDAGLMETGLLEDMAACGCEARTIKVASGGLDERFLWENVSSAGGGERRRMLKSMRPFAGDEDIRGAVLGEGGEYETLALDGPGFLWKQKIVIDDVQTKRGDAGVGFMRLKGAKCVPKTVEEQEITPKSVRRPLEFDRAFADVCQSLISTHFDLETPYEVKVKPEQFTWKHEPNQTRSGKTWTISNITAPEAGSGTGEQMQAIASKTQAILESSGSRSTDDIVFATVLLRSMADFALMNSVYVSLFKKTNPPARVAVACDSLPEGVNIMISFVVDLGPRDLRQGLHVQSRSYWAPANIGPYSQAISIPIQKAGNLVYIAGQVPLDPASMIIFLRQPDAYEGLVNYSARAALALQHMCKIGAATQVKWWLGAVAFVAGHSPIMKARLAWNAWETIHRRPKEEEEGEEPDLDNWRIRYDRRRYEEPSSSKTTSNPTLPNFSVVQSDGLIPPFFALQMGDLPRECDIEWQGLGFQGDHLKMSVREIYQGRTIDTACDGLRYTGIEIGIEQSGPNLETCLQEILDSYCQKPMTSHATIYTAQSLPEGIWPGQIIPCTAVWGQYGRQLAAGVIVQTISADEST